MEVEVRSVAVLAAACFPSVAGAPRRPATARSSFWSSRIFGFLEAPGPCVWMAGRRRGSGARGFWSLGFFAAASPLPPAVVQSLGGSVKELEAAFARRLCWLRRTWWLTDGGAAGGGGRWLWSFIEQGFVTVWRTDSAALSMRRCSRMEVTEFSCGGFVVGLISVHTIADGLGAGQFINAVADYARGLPKPRVSPVWARDLVPDPPRMPAPPPKLELLDLRGLTVDFSPDHVAKVKADFFASTGQRCSAFDVCVAKTWQSRTRALLLDGGNFTDDSPVHVCFFANTRHLMLAGAGAGFYGNCFYPVTVTCRSGEVAAGEVVDVVRAVRDAKARLAGDVAKWAVGGFAQDPYELRFTYDSLFISDWTRLGFLEADYGWGAPAHVVPFSYHPFMAVAVIGAPPAPKVGSRVMTMCVEEAHLPEFRDQMNAFASSAGK